MLPSIYLLSFSSLFLSTYAKATSHESRRLTARGDCGGSTQIMDKDDVLALAQDLQNNNPNDMTDFPARARQHWSNGTAQVCIENNYYFEHTHVSRWEVGWAVKYIYDNCCNTAANSQWSVSPCTFKSR